MRNARKKKPRGKNGSANFSKKNVSMTAEGGAKPAKGGRREKLFLKGTYNTTKRAPKVRTKRAPSSPQIRHPEKENFNPDQVEKEKQQKQLVPGGERGPPHVLAQETRSCPVAKGGKGEPAKSTLEGKAADAREDPRKKISRRERGYRHLAQGTL